jgi:hypothetical protein
MLELFIYITRLASKEIFSPSKKIQQKVGRAKDLSAPLYILVAYILILNISEETCKAIFES